MPLKQTRSQKDAAAAEKAEKYKILMREIRKLEK
jgi:hypothetical protein